MAVKQRKQPSFFVPGRAAKRPRSTGSPHACTTSYAVSQDITCRTRVPRAPFRLPPEVTNVDWQHRAQFFALSARIMRNILLDNARARASAKRGGLQARVNLDEIPDVAARRGSELMALDDALTALAKIDPRRAQVIELRFFGGLSVDETAAVMKVSEETVMRDARVARAWLKIEQ